MVRKYILFALFFVLVCSSFVSAFSVSSWFKGTFTGKVTLEPICADTDGGLNYYVQGTVTQINPFDNATITYTDSCYNSTLLQEWSCGNSTRASNLAANSFYGCPYPSICNISAGACTSVPQTPGTYNICQGKVARSWHSSRCNVRRVCSSGGLCENKSVRVSNGFGGKTTNYYYREVCTQRYRTSCGSAPSCGADGKVSTIACNF